MRRWSICLPTLRSHEHQVYVTDENGFRLLERGDGLPAIGFPKADVFRFDDSVAQALERDEPWDRGNLIPWNL